MKVGSGMKTIWFNLRLGIRSCGFWIKGLEPEVEPIFGIKIEMKWKWNPIRFKIYELKTGSSLKILLDFTHLAPFPILLHPVLPERAAVRLLAHEIPRVLLNQIVRPVKLVLHHVNNICKKTEPEMSKSPILSPNLSPSFLLFSLLWTLPTPRFFKSEPFSPKTFSWWPPSGQ